MAPKPHHCPHHTLTVHQQPWGAAGLPHGTGTAPLTDLRHKHKKSHRYPGTQRCSLPVTVSSHTTHPQTLQGTQRQAQPPSCPPYQGDPSPIQDSSSAPCTAGADPAARRDPSASHIYSLQVHRAPVTVPHLGTQPHVLQRAGSGRMGVFSGKSVAFLVKGYKVCSQSTLR